MDLSKLKTVKISKNARSRIIKDYFPGEDEEYTDEDFDERHMGIHAGALSLYATTLITKIYETAPETIALESNERELEYRSLLKSNPKLAHLSDEEINTKAHDMILRDIRNSFAHGNFEISYDIYSKRLHFVLMPRRKDYVTDTPIVISKNALKKANGEFLAKEAMKYTFMSREQANAKIAGNFGGVLKTMILPSQMLQFSDSYLEKNSRVKQTPMNDNRFLFIQYILYATQLTYEQDDYYRIFGKDSKVFGKIALVRNAIAHDSFAFLDGAKKVNYDDRTVSLNESLAKSVSSLAIAQDQKNAVIYCMNKEHKPESLESLVKLLEYCFDTLFSGEGEITEFPFKEIPKF